MKILFVFAHPDDETFSSGGTIAMLSKGHAVKLICATRGEAGELGDPPLCSQDQLGKVREKELKSAAKILGIKQIYFLDYIDGKLKKISQKEIISKITVILKKENPDVVITFNEEGGSGHPDHISITKATTAAFDIYVTKAKKPVKLYYRVYPSFVLKRMISNGMYVFADVKGDISDKITTTIDIKKTLNTKMRAAKEHKTQNKDFRAILKNAKYREFSLEYFKLVKSNSLF